MIGRPTERLGEAVAFLARRFRANSNVVDFFAHERV